MFFNRAARQRSRAEARAPGWVDLLGGPSRHQGALVLQMPLSREVHVTVEEVEGHGVTVEQAGGEPVELDFRPFKEALRRRAPRHQLRALFKRAEVPERARLPLGSLLIFSETRVWVFGEGLRISIRSEVPAGGGLGASSAVQIAVLLALEKVAGRQFLSTEAGRIAHQARRDLIGDSSTLADKLAPAHAEAGALLPVLCRPDELFPLARMPEDLLVVGWPGAEAGKARREALLRSRTAAFMGRKILERCLGRAWHYSAEIPLSLFLRHARENVPLRMKGSLFTELVDTAIEPPLRVCPSETYEVNAALRFPIEEHFRCTLALSLLRGLDADNREEILGQVGELMLQSHEGLAPAGLGCAEADRRVDALMDLGPDRGVYGARLCGDGVEGTVVALVSRQGLSHAQAMLARTTPPGEEPPRLVH